METKYNTTIVCKVTKVIYQDQKSGRAILSTVRDNDKSCRLLGNIQNVEIGSMLEATGEWEKNEKYGWQFVAESIQNVYKSDEQELVEDGLIHALDFSNVLNKSLKSFRNVDLECECADVVCDIDFDKIEVPIKKKDAQKSSNPNKKDIDKTKANTTVKDGACYNIDLSLLISGPREQPMFSIPNSVKIIGGGSFADSMLETIQIPDSVEVIKNGAFSDCKKLTSVNISRSVEQIGDLVFAGCKNLVSIKVDKDNDTYCDVDGVLYNHDLSQLLYVPNGLTSVSIRESARAIKLWAFRGCDKLTHLSIPPTLTNIEHGEFASCSQIRSAVIPRLIADEGIYCYFDCKTLKSVTLDSSVTHINSETFKGCVDLQLIEISYSVQDIDKHAFDDCISLESIVVDDNNPYFRTIDGVLYDYDVSRIIWIPRGKTSVVIPNTIKRIADNDFLNHKQLVSITIPESVTSIGSRAFEGCKGLTSLEIPDSITSIGECAFAYCEGLKSVIITDVAKWCNIVFHHGTHSSFYILDSDYSANPLVYAQQLVLNGNVLKELIIPGCVDKIKDIAFFNCKSLEHVTIENGVEEIGALAFYGCNNLVIDIPDTVTRFGADAFKGCKSFILDKTVNIDWDDVLFKQNSIRVPNQIGGWTEIEDINVNASMNSMRKHLAKIIPYLTVCFGPNGKPSIVNAKELHDAVITLTIKNDLTSLIRDGYKPSEILKRIDGLSEKLIREFVPRDMSPYINFLLEKHAADKYPIVPIVEYIGGSREDGALYTIMIDGQPNIVWENHNDSRSTYVFSCTVENYNDTRQRVFDYIMAEETGKRKLLHTDKCTEIFKEKPRMIVHNNLTSWAQKVMCDPELTIK